MIKWLLRKPWGPGALWVSIMLTYMLQVYLTTYTVGVEKSLVTPPMLSPDQSEQ